MNEDIATNKIAKYPKLLDFAEKNDIAMAEVMRMCGYKGKVLRNPGSYKGHRVVINSLGEHFLKKDKDIRAFI